MLNLRYKTRFIISSPGVEDRCRSFCCKYYPLGLHILPQVLVATCSPPASLLFSPIVVVLPVYKPNVVNRIMTLVIKENDCIFRLSKNSYLN